MNTEQMSSEKYGAGNISYEKLSRKAILEKSLENYGYILIASDLDAAAQAAVEDE